MMEYFARGNSTEMFGPPTKLDIILAPVIVIILVILSVLLYSVITQYKWWKSKFNRSNNISQIQLINNSDDKLFIKSLDNPLPDNSQVKTAGNPITSPCLDKDDLCIIDKFVAFQNNPISLCWIAFPLLVSLLFCPLVILTFPPLLNFFWPKEFVPEIPKINDVVSAFLMPAGLLYAVSFGFAFQDVLAKRDTVDACLEKQNNYIRQSWELIKSCEALSANQKWALGKNLKNEIVIWMAQLLNCKHQKNSGTIWDNVAIIQEVKISKTQKKEYYDEKLLDTIFNHLLELEALFRSDILKGKKSITILQWTFLEAIGFISFFGILLLKADSYRLELTMCMLTVFSISAFSYVLADLDSPYHGGFKVDLKFSVEAVDKLNKECTYVLSQNMVIQ